MHFFQLLVLALNLPASLDNIVIRGKKKVQNLQAVRVYQVFLPGEKYFYSQVRSLVFPDIAVYKNVLDTR